MKLALAAMNRNKMAGSDGIIRDDSSLRQFQYQEDYENNKWNIWKWSYTRN